MQRPYNQSGDCGDHPAGHWGQRTAADNDSASAPARPVCAVALQIVGVRVREPHSAPAHICMVHFAHTLFVNPATIASIAHVRSSAWIARKI
jgi:hypothetical protein